jgi:A/G-specific adenine glycosylase
MPILDIAGLERWFEQEKRTFPWRLNPSPYAVWISEVMLQQTQASVVINYFERWMGRFPDISSLASASFEEVLKFWEGLGYYSRARNLHSAAKYLMEHCGGKLPSTQVGLEKIKGLGPYTVGAILSFAFHQKSPAVDGNVVRVIARHFLIEDDITKSASQKKIREFVWSVLPDTSSWIIMEALIELGARICRRKPNCGICPLQRTCLGYRHGKASHLPIKPKSSKAINLLRCVPVIIYGSFFLLRKGTQGKVMADLYEFPYFEIQSFNENKDELKQKLKLSLKVEPEFCGDLPTIIHTFTKYKAELYPSLWKVNECVSVKGCKWVSREYVGKLTFSAGHRRILNNILSIDESNLESRIVDANIAY